MLPYSDLLKSRAHADLKVDHRFRAVPKRLPVCSGAHRTMPAINEMDSQLALKTANSKVETLRRDQQLACCR